MPMGQTEDVMNQRLLLIEISLTGIHEKLLRNVSSRGRRK